MKATALAALGCIAEAGASLSACHAANGDVPDIQALAVKLQGRSADPGRSFYGARSELRLPSWLNFAEPRDILFPAEIPQELFYAIQRLIYQEEVVTILDVGAGEGLGSTRAVMEAFDGRKHSLFCVEPDEGKCALIRQRYGEDANTSCGSSVAVNRYISETELTAFYREQPSILNYYPLDTVIRWRRDELAALTAGGAITACIDEIRRVHGIAAFDMAILDGSLFTGTADLAAVYGARYLLLNHVRSVKNCTNMLRLYADPQYEVVELNHKLGCGYAVFRRKVSTRS